MLHLHHSNQLELLAAQFAALQRAAPLEPMQQEQVVVQNSGMGRWLSLQTAQHNGIAANIRYLFPAELTWELLRTVLGENTVPPQDPCAPHILRWRLLDVLLSEGDAWQELSPYLRNGAAAAWQLAGQLAKVFDQYLFFRPQWIRAWEA
ncbi:MAG: exodeoxyribonuclease V subunit gamma, partial [Thiothrix sp.]